MRGDREGKIERVRAGKTGGSDLPSRALTALTTSALAVPGLVTAAHADTPIEQASADYAFSLYQEDDLDPGNFSGQGSRERYEVFTHQLEFALPVSQRMDAGVEFLYEKMSGASPWYVEAAGTERVQVMSGATIDDTRYDLNTNLNYYLEDAKDSFTAGFSKEQDYFSVNGGLGTERSFFDKNTVFSASGGFSYDWIKPNNPGLSLARPCCGEKWSIDLFAGLSPAADTRLRSPAHGQLQVFGGLPERSLQGDPWHRPLRRHHLRSAPGPEAPGQRDGALPPSLRDDGQDRRHAPRRLPLLRRRLEIGRAHV